MFTCVADRPHQEMQSRGSVCCALLVALSVSLQVASSVGERAIMYMIIASYDYLHMHGIC